MLVAIGYNICVRVYINIALINSLMDNQVSAAGYVITFFNDIESLTNAFSYYSNLLSKLKGKYPTKDFLAKLPQEEKDEIQRITQDTRFWLNRTYVKFSALKAQIKDFNQKAETVDKLYNELVNQPVPVFDTLKQYVVELNTLFVLGIVSTLLRKAYDIYAQFSGKTE
jgi:hypothetical protein